MKMHGEPFFSIVIPTLNEEKCLPLLLEDLANQTFPYFEVIHVDGKSDDKTVEVAENWRDSLSLKTYSADVQNVSQQRNLGAKHAKAPWVIFMDADNRLPKYFLDGVKYALARDESIDLFTTLVETKHSDASYVAIYQLVNASIIAHKLMKKPMSYGAMIGAKKEIFSKVTFDSKQKVVEDIYFIRTAEKAGFSFSVLKEPRYQYSLRRLEKEGIIRMAAQQATIGLRQLRNESFADNNYGYEMKGGSYYSNSSPPFFPDILKLLKKATKEHLRQIRLVANEFLE